MRSPQPAAPHDDPPSALVRAELERVLASEIFARSDRLTAFLRFIVEQTLEGHGDALKEHVIAIELYGKSSDFNAAADPIVRVDARRLRDKLREYYASAQQDAIVISVPKGSYTPAFEPIRPASDAAPLPAADAKSQDAMSSDTWRRLPIALALLVVLVVAAWLLTRFGTVLSPPMRLLTVTSLPGAEEDPSLSPDGNFVTFSWNGPDSSGNSDIWVKPVEGDELRRLTDTPDASEIWPAWSPDGRHIAFTRRLAGRPLAVLMVSALGGPERMIAERSANASWAPDGKSLVMRAFLENGRAGLVHHVLETGARRVLAESPALFSDYHPRVSPDGKTVAFTRGGFGRSAVFAVPTIGGDARQLDDWSRGVIGGLSWTADGREILYGRPELSGRRLIRVAASGEGSARAVSDAPRESVAPSVSNFRSAQSYRLAFVSGQLDLGLRIIDLRAALKGRTIAAVASYSDATRVDLPGRFSPDGTHVAFVSDRSGSQQVWVAGRDGSALRSVTRLQDATVSVGAWSPDGRWVTFDATVGDNTDVYIVRTDGERMKRMTQSPASEIDPEWSRDGRWIYYASNESGPSTIWRMPAGGGPGVQLTSEVGFEPRESPDGKSIYFVDRRRDYALGPVATLRQVPTDGGPSSVVEPRVMPAAWEVTDRGVVFVVGGANPPDATQPDTLAVYDFAERRVRSLGELPFRVAPFAANRFLAVSRDGHWALASHIDKWDRDIMVIDNFR